MKRFIIGSVCIVIGLAAFFYLVSYIVDDEPTIVPERRQDHKVVQGAMFGGNWQDSDGDNGDNNDNATATPGEANFDSVRKKCPYGKRLDSRGKCRIMHT